MRSQFFSLFHRYDLLIYVDSTLPCPTFTIIITESTNSKTQTVAPQTLLNPFFHDWKRQDQLLLHAILISASEGVVPSIAYSQTSKHAWEKIQGLYAAHSSSKVMHLCEKLTKLRENTPVTEYLEGLRCVTDELALILSILTEEELVIHALNGIGNDFREIRVGIQAHETPNTFEELVEKMVMSWI